MKTSGSKGFHIVVPLDGTSGFGEVAGFAHAVGPAPRDPRSRTTSRRSSAKVDRGNRILIDTGRNGYSATFAAPYAVRPKPGAPISAPCTWDELERRDRSVHGRSRCARCRRASLTSVTCGRTWRERPGADRGDRETSRAPVRLSLLANDSVAVARGLPPSPRRGLTTSAKATVVRRSFSEGGKPQPYNGDRQLSRTSPGASRS